MAACCRISSGKTSSTLPRKLTVGSSIEPDVRHATGMASQEQAGPATRGSLTADLELLGLRAGMTVLVHTSLSALGWVVGGEQTVLRALRDAVGPTGTLVMPTQSWQLCDPAYLNDPATPRDWWPLIRDTSRCTTR